MFCVNSFLRPHLLVNWKILKRSIPNVFFKNSSLVSVMGNVICQVQDLKKKILEGMLLTGHTFFNFFGSLYFAKNKYLEIFLKLQKSWELKPWPVIALYISQMEHFHESFFFCQQVFKSTFANFNLKMSRKQQVFGQLWENGITNHYETYCAFLSYPVGVLKL